MAFSKVRIDPLVGVYNFRGYAEDGDASVPLDDESRQYKIVGTVNISGDTATVSATCGDMSDKDMQRDFDAELKARGVTKLRWERHHNGRITYYTREIK